MTNLEELRRSSLFDGLTDEQLAEVIEQGSEARVPRGEIYAREGEPIEHFYVVLEGELRITRKVDGRDMVLNTYGPGVFFGEVPLLASVRAAGRLREYFESMRTIGMEVSRLASSGSLSPEEVAGIERVSTQALAKAATANGQGSLEHSEREENLARWMEERGAHQGGSEAPSATIVQDIRSTKERSFAPLLDVSLGDLVPENNFYRRLERSFDLSLVRPFYARGDRLSVDPVVFFKLQLVMFFEGTVPRGPIDE